MLGAIDLQSLTAPAAALSRPWLATVHLNPDLPLTEEEVAAIAVLNNPEVKAARARAKVADAQILTASLPPDLTFGASTDLRLSGPDLGNGWASQIGYELTALRDRGLTVKGAKFQQRQVRLDLAWQEWTVAEQAKILAGRVIATRALALLAETTLNETRAALSRAEAAAGRGDIGSTDLDSRRAAFLDATDRAAQTKSDEFKAALDLNSLLGLKPETQLSLQAAPAEADGPEVAAEQLFSAARAQRLDLMALRAGLDASDLTVRKAIRDAFPSFALTLNLTTDTAGNRTLGPGVSMTLPLWNRNQGPIAEAKASREALRLDYATRLFQTRNDLAALVEQLDNVRRKLKQARAMAPELGGNARLVQDAASGGDLTLATAEAARQSARDREANLIVLEQALRETRIGLELSSGTPDPLLATPKSHPFAK